MCTGEAPSTRRQRRCVWEGVWEVCVGVPLEAVKVRIVCRLLVATIGERAAGTGSAAVGASWCKVKFAN